MKTTAYHHRQMSVVVKTAVASVSYLAIAVAGSSGVHAQATSGQSAESQLPPVRVDEPNRAQRRARNTPAPSQSATIRRRQQRTAQPPAPPAPTVPADSQDARTGTVGIYANSTSVATKSNTPLLNIPQSVSVLTKDFIKDQAFQNLTDYGRYVPGVAVHQGEGNRDELVIRGVDSSANFFVNGFRDDVQIFRDLYNTQSIEVLKGPSALTFGRGAGGGLVNRTLKEADGTPIYEATAQTGSFADRRFTVDAGRAVNENVAVRLNGMYEGSDGFRDYTKLERYGINPTVTFTPNDTTRVKLSYEYFHDDRTADRGNPSLAVPGVPGGASRAIPASPFAPFGDLTTFFGSPDLNKAIATVNSVMAVVDHDFQNGLTVKNSARYANYEKFYQNVYPGTAVNLAAPAGQQFSLTAYQHTTNRENLIDQTDFLYKANTGPLFHTIGFGTEFGHQQGIDVRNSGVFSNGSTLFPTDPFSPTFFGSVDFIHHDLIRDPVTGALLFNDGVANPDSDSHYRLNTQSGYARDTIDVTRWLQVIGGVRYDRFDLSARNGNPDPDTGVANVTRSRTDNMVSPQAAVILKPQDNLSFYGTYMVSYLPASGDQFSALNKGSVIIEPQKFDSKEIGVKWNILPRLQYSAAVYQLDRTNVPLADPNNAGFFILSGKNRIRGFETALTGYVTSAWQTTLGYAYTDARIASDTSATIVTGNRVQLVPFNQVSLWNKYQFNETWGAGLGVIYFSDSFAASDDLVKLPGFVRVDASVYLRINENWKAQFNVENVFDKGYWASADGNNNLQPGQGRTFRIMATARF